MSIKFNDNFKISTGKPINSVYYNASGLPYVDQSEVFTQIPLSYRFVGLTVNIAGEEYWFQNDLEALVGKGAGDAGTVVVDPEITLSGTTYGNYADGDTIQSGTSVQEVLTNMMTLTQLPTMNLTPNSQNKEVGTVLDLNLDSVFNQNDAGAINQYTLDKVYNSVSSNLVDNPSVTSYNDVGDTVLEGAESVYTAKVFYDWTALVDAGNIEDITTITGVRAYFYVGDTGTSAPTTSALVRGLGNSDLAPENGTTFTIDIPSGATRVVFAYPDSLQAVSSVKYVELGNGEVKDTFSLSTVNTEGANSFAGVDYKVYTYLPAVPFGGAATYNVTI